MNLGKLIKIIALAILGLSLIIMLVMAWDEQSIIAPAILMVSSIPIFILGEVVERLYSIDKHLYNIEYYLMSSMYWDDNTQ